MTNPVSIQLSHQVSYLIMMIVINGDYKMQLLTKLTPILSHDNIILLCPEKLAFIGVSSRPAFDYIHSWFEGTKKQLLAQGVDLDHDNSCWKAAATQPAVVFNHDSNSINNYHRNNFVTMTTTDSRAANSSIVNLLSTTAAAADEYNRQSCREQTIRAMACLRPRHSGLSVNHSTSQLEDLLHGELVNKQVVARVTWHNFTDEHWHAYLDTLLASKSPSPVSTLLALRSQLLKTPLTIKLSLMSQQDSGDDDDSVSRKQLYTLMVTSASAGVVTVF